VRGFVDRCLRFSRVSMAGTRREDDGQDGFITCRWGCHFLWNYLGTQVRLGFLLRVFSSNKVYNYGHFLF
jgi:hypothetical protein